MNLLPFLFCIIFLFNLIAFAQEEPENRTLVLDRTMAGELIVEPPTLLCAGFEWKIYGDENRNAIVNVWFRLKGKGEWRDAQPLLRIGKEKIYGHGQRWVYTVPDMFAGSIFDLEPGKEYECRLRMEDPDGVDGINERIVTIKTRQEPEPYDGGQVYHVYPPGYDGKKENPAFTGINEAYYGKGNLGDWWLVPEPRVNPGDILLVHAGLYKADRLDYVDPLALQFHGAYVFTKDGTPDKPIVIKAAGDGEVIFDGDGAYRLFDVMAADHHYFEGLTIRNVDIAFYAGLKKVKGSSGLTVKNCRMEDIGIGVMTHSEESKDFYIADNIMIGRHDPDTLVGWYGLEHPNPLTSYYGVKVYGQGHVICHNTISYFHDGICIDTHGLPEESQDQKCVSIDIYRNDIFNMSDDFIEADGGVHNIRIFENRGFNAYHAALSAQPVFGGPVYFIRNLLYNVPSTSLKFMIRPAGIFVYHNTFCMETAIYGFSNGHFRNNLFMGHDLNRPVFSGSTFTTYSTMDYNGYRKKGKSGSLFIWNQPANTIMNHCDRTELEQKEFKTLAQFNSDIGYEDHGLELDYDIFEDAKAPDPQKKGHVYALEGIDLRLKKSSTAVDSGCILPNINDNHTGKAPDLGAIEYGFTLMYYGVRTK